MKITVALEKGYLPDRYSKYSQERVSGEPRISFPFTLNDLPQETKYLAWLLLDYDSVPVCGFTWIHWLVDDVPVRTKVKADFNRNYDGPQGYNSEVSSLLNEPKEVQTRYIGPTPPDRHMTIP